MKDWKACERRVAEVLGGVRVPITGRQRGATPDVEHAALSIEVKAVKAYQPGSWRPCTKRRPRPRTASCLWRYSTRTANLTGMRWW